MKQVRKEKTKEDSIWAKKKGEKKNGGEWIGWKERL